MAAHDEQLQDKVQTAGRADMADRIAKMKTAMTGMHNNGDLTMEVQMVRQQATPTALCQMFCLKGPPLRPHRSGCGRLPRQRIQQLRYLGGLTKCTVSD